MWRYFLKDWPSVWQKCIYTRPETISMTNCHLYYKLKGRIFCRGQLLGTDYFCGYTGAYAAQPKKVLCNFNVRKCNVSLWKYELLTQGTPLLQHTSAAGQRYAAKWLEEVGLKAPDTSWVIKSSAYIKREPHLYFRVFINLSYRRLVVL